MNQDEAFEILKTGNNVFVTGSAGSGKTHLINRYIAYLNENNVDVAVTASTGIAATHMGGVTIHSWSGLGIRDSLSESDLDYLEGRQYLWKRFQNVKVLIIDEVSMLHHFRLDLVDKVLKHFRRSDKPFGGIQVVLVGDFFQLPPISRMGEPKAYFVFRSEAWRKADFTICYLTTQYRQTDDAFLNVLNAIRSNDLDSDVGSYLQERFQQKIEMDIEPTRLYTHNIDVDQVNADSLVKIKGKATTYDMVSHGKEKYVELLKKSCLAPTILGLKVGARVMCVKNNFEAGFANGTSGVVVACEPNQDPIIKTANGKLITIERASWRIEDEGNVRAELIQYPLRLAWAITVHKSQGMSLDAVEVDLSKSFEKGMGYVALSRVRTLAGLSLLGFNQMALQVNEEVLEFDQQLRSLSESARQALAETSSQNLERTQEEFMKRVSGGRTLKKQKVKIVKLSTLDTTREFVLSKTPLAEIAKKRDITVETIVSHIEKLIEEDASLDIAYLISDMSHGKRDQIAKAIKKNYEISKNNYLSPVRDMLGPKFSYLDIRLVRLIMKKESLI